MPKARTYWDTFLDPYQMGMMSHREFLLDLLKEKGVKSFLDVGCGTGPLYQLIRDTWKDQGHKRWDFVYKGSDYSWAMIDICKRSFLAGNFVVQDARDLIEPDNSYDAVVLMHCLDHLDDYQAAIREAARVARKYVLIVLWRPLSTSDTNGLNDRNMYGKKEGEEPWEDTHLQDYSESRLKEAFKEANLTVELQTNGPEINKEGKFNTLFLLKK
jgi:ubiquinone/menaquinone biosynthesis C-methylase UbiE